MNAFLIMRSLLRTNAPQPCHLLLLLSAFQFTGAFLDSGMHPIPWSAVGLSSSFEDSTHLLTKTRQQIVTEALPGSETMTLPRPTSLNHNIPRDISRLSYPLAAGAVAIQTMLVQPTMDKMGDLLRCAMETNEICFRATNPATIETKVLTTLGHLALDAVALVGAPSSMSAMGLRGITVLGHLFTTTANHVQDAGVTNPEEWMFQILTLFWAFSNLFKHLSHHAVSRFLSPVPTSRNLRAFKLLFEPSGMNFYQFNTLSSFAVDWVTLEEGRVVHNSPESLYWLYKGNINVQNNDSKATYSLYANPITRDWSAKVQTGLLGDLDFLRELDFPSDDSSPGTQFQAFLDQFHVVSCSQSDDEECVVSGTDSKGESWTVGPGGATLMHINTQTAFCLLRDYDETVEKSLRNMVLQGIQSKLHLTFSQS